MTDCNFNSQTLVDQDQPVEDSCVQLTPAEATPTEACIAVINTACLNAMRRGKAMLTDVLKAGAELREAKRQQGDAFPGWVNTKVAIDVSDANRLINFVEAGGVHEADLSPAVEVKPARLLELVALLGATPTSAAKSVPPKPRATIADVVDKNPRGTRSAECDQKLKPTAPSKPRPKPDLSPDQRRLILGYSKKLFAAVMRREVGLEDALRTASGRAAGAS